MILYDFYMCDVRHSLTGGPFALGLHEIMAIGIYARQPLVAAVLIDLEKAHHYKVTTKSLKGWLRGVEKAVR
jgi:hypothetical protein